MQIDAEDNAGSTAADLALENNFYGVHSVLEEASSESPSNRSPLVSGILPGTP